jgi:predicted MPP superfamily phosphohydrolase
MIRFLIIIGIFSFIDYYVWTGVKVYFYESKNLFPAKWIYILTSVITIIGFIITLLMFMGGKAIQNASLNLFMGLVFIIMLPKIIFGCLLLAEDVLRILFSAVVWIKNWGGAFVLVSRLKVYSLVALIAAGLVMLLMAHGVFFNKYRYNVKKVTLTFDNLPAAFDGYKVVQISDVHSGSFDNREKVEKGIELINDQNADLFVFTGDLVNMRAEEFVPYIPVFAKIKARDGKYSILGNHDYGDYVRFGSPVDKWRNHNLLEVYEHRAGFNLLLNRHEYIKRGNDSIFIVGVENWGHPPFLKRGKLDVAMNGVPNGAFALLLSHDPSHWDDIVSKQSQNVALTLSGHTHGMQFGIDFWGMKWSPVQWKYPLWSGLYERNGMKLYVNVGFGFLGLPGRVGILPEITVFTLKRKA